MNQLADQLQHMQEAALQITEHLAGLDKQRFLTDKLRQQAVALNLIVIGEVATKLLQNHADFLACYPAIEWKTIKGMRNRIAHGYFDIDHEVVWDTVQNSLPALLRQLETMREVAEQAGPE